MRIPKRIKAIELKPGDILRLNKRPEYGVYIAKVVYSPKGKVLAYSRCGNNPVTGEGLLANQWVTILVDDGNRKKSMM
jgi:hypothetical protein